MHLGRYRASQEFLRQEPRTWLVTGAAGFIGSNLVELLLGLNQSVVGLDNFATGSRGNIESVLASRGSGAGRFRFIEGDIRDLECCREACRGAEYVLHQAAVGSVPRSIQDPLTTHAANVNGFLNVLIAARDEGVRRFVYATSSSTYGDHPGLPKVEDVIGRPLSPYAVSKLTNEMYADVFQRVYGVQTVGLRYFNVFGPRQDPDGPYAAVIPRWVSNLLAGEPCVINGDGETSRDFCYIENVLQANLLAAVVEGENVTGQVYNVALGQKTTLNELFRMIRSGLAVYWPEVSTAEPFYTDFRPGDVRHSQADIGKISSNLGYHPTHTVAAGLEQALGWYVESLNRTR